MFMGLAFYSFSPFYEDFNEKIGQMIAAGLTNEIERELRPLVAPEEIGPQVLSMEHLGVAFLICFFPFIICTYAFIIEISIPIIKTFVQNLILVYLILTRINKYSHRYWTNFKFCFKGITISFTSTWIFAEQQLQWKLISMNTKFWHSWKKLSCHSLLLKYWDLKQKKLD